MQSISVSSPFFLFSPSDLYKCNPVVQFQPESLRGASEQGKMLKQICWRLLSTLLAEADTLACPAHSSWHPRLRQQWSVQA